MRKGVTVVTDDTRGGNRIEEVKHTTDQTEPGSRFREPARSRAVVPTPEEYDHA
jgi:hypothetical protein